MEELDIYDFDKTIVPFDSGSLFCLYCLVRYPWTVLFLPLDAAGLLLALTGVISFTAYKRLCFAFVALIPLDKAVRGFWDRYEKRVHKWFFSKRRKAVVISASPDFLLEEIKRRIDIDVLICTRHNRKTGAIIGENCRGSQKVKRFYEIYSSDDVRVVDVYSDSLVHDEPIFSLATGDCYHIVKGARKKFSYKKYYNK